MEQLVNKGWRDGFINLPDVPCHWRDESPNMLLQAWQYSSLETIRFINCGLTCSPPYKYIFRMSSYLQSLKVDTKSGLNIYYFFPYKHVHSIMCLCSAGLPVILNVLLWKLWNLKLLISLIENKSELLSAVPSRSPYFVMDKDRFHW